MGAGRLPMRQIREILRLKYEQGLRHRAIAKACGVSVGTVSEYVQRARRAALCWPLPAELDDEALEARLFSAAKPSREQRGVPDLPAIHQELKPAGVTLHLLWEEYRGVHPRGYGYSQFCEHYRCWAGKLNRRAAKHADCSGGTAWRSCKRYSGPTPKMTLRPVTCWRKMRLDWGGTGT